MSFGWRVKIRRTSYSMLILWITYLCSKRNQGLKTLTEKVFWNSIKVIVLNFFSFHSFKQATQSYGVQKNETRLVFHCGHSLDLGRKWLCSQFSLHPMLTCGGPCEVPKVIGCSARSTWTPTWSFPFQGPVSTQPMLFLRNELYHQLKLQTYSHPSKSSRIQQNSLQFSLKFSAFKQI